MNLDAVDHVATSCRCGVAIDGEQSTGFTSLIDASVVCMECFAQETMSMAWDEHESMVGRSVTDAGDRLAAMDNGEWVTSRTCMSCGRAFENSYHITWSCQRYMCWECIDDDRDQ